MMNYQIKYLSTRECQTCLPKEAGSSSSGTSIPQLKITAGAIFTITKKIMQYHLAGTTEQYIRETPMKLILDEARLLGNRLGMESLHLGGGVGGSDEDSLFKFKSGFSDKQCEFKVWQYITDITKYNELSKDIADKNSNFFPLYRSK